MNNQKGKCLIPVLFVILIIFFFMSGFNNTSNNKTNTVSTNKNNSSNVNSTTGNITTSSSSSLGKDFKQAMDSYEAFIDEYIAFIKKYSNTKAPTSQMFIDYGEYMKKNIEMAAAFEKWESNNLNKEEAKYYVEVQMRVNQKLMNASIDLQYQ